MTGLAFTLFDTAIGTCGVAWGDRGLTGVALPGRDPDATRAWLARRHDGAVETEPTAAVADAIARIAALVRGEPADLTPIVLDLDRVPAFHRRVYAVARAIGPGATLTYGDIARRVGAPGSAQAVGQALGRNPWPLVVPCHRVLAAGGDGGFSAPGGVVTKRRLLAIEGALSLFDADALGAEVARHSA